MAEHTPHTDKELFDLIAGEDQSAFRQLLNRYQADIFGQALSYLKDVQKAEDLVQEVFMLVWNNRHKLKEMANPVGYLLVAARNKIFTELRKKLFETIPGHLEDQLVEGAPVADTQMEQRQMMAIIQSAIDRLPPQRRRIFELSKKDGKKYQEIADELGISKETVRVQMVKALAFIRNMIYNETWLLIACFIFL